MNRSNPSPVGNAGSAGFRRWSSRGFTFWWLVALLSWAAALPATAQQQFQGVCARVKIEILQELAIERIGFEATLEITNNVGGDPITDFFADLTFTDPKDIVDGVPRDVSNRFFVQRPRITDVNSVDGSGVIGPTKTAIIRWFIIPTPGAGGESPLGKEYEVGVDMSGKMAGVDLPKSIFFAIPDTITVRPEPLLEITYFQPRDVQGDDPFTIEVESPIPFTLGVLVKNSGFGPARSVRIDSQQPRIVENTAGLLLIARLLGARVMDAPLNESSLVVNLGDIQPGETKKGAWDMITSLSGEFVEFKASYTHSAELGGQETSVIKSIAAHFIAHEVLNNDPGRDAILDFLADTDRDELILPDSLYESQGQINPVNHQPDAAVSTPLSGQQFVVTVNAGTEGWGYVRLDDPGQAKLGFTSVVRDDGKVINPHNVWTNIRYRRTDNAKLTFLNLFDRLPTPGTRTYTITYANPPPDTTAPDTRLRFSGEVTQSGGNFYITRETQMYFTSDDASPVSIEYRLDSDADFRPAVPFRISTPGAHVVYFHATDRAGNVEAVKTAALIVQGSGPSFGTVDVRSGSLALTGESLSFRPANIAIDLPVAGSPVAVDAQIDIFRGVRVWPSIAGGPVSPTPQTVTTLVVSGENVDFYRYRHNGGPWSAERSVATPFTLSGLAGNVTVDVVARSQHGGYPADSEALTVSWVVNAAAQPFSVAGLPATPTRLVPAPLVVSAPGADLFRWKPNASFFRAEAAPGTPFDFPVTTTGQQTLYLLAHSGGVWPPDSAAATYGWLFAPDYGSDLSSLPLVFTRSIPAVQGTTISFVWDGRNNGGVQQLPGWYTVRVRLTDELGNVTFRNQLVRIEELVTTPETLVAAPAGPEKPDARGDWLVWQQRGSGTPNIFARFVGGTGDPAFAVTTSTLNQENPRTDRRYAVWQGRRENGNWDIFIADLNDPTAITAVTATTNRNEVNPRVDWPWVVWQSKDLGSPSAPWQIQATNLETAQFITVDPTATDQLDPAIHAGRVVWQDFRDVGFGEIYFRDLEGGVQRRLTNNSFGQYHPDISGHWVVWQDNRNTQVDLYGFDLLRGSELRLTNTPANEAFPRIADNWVLLTEDSAGVLSENFVLLDLGTGRSVPLTRSSTQKSSGTIADGRLFWQRGSSGTSVIEASTVPALQPVFQNFNAVAVSAALATARGNAFSLLQAWNADAGVTSLIRFQSLAPLTVQTATLTGGVPTGDNFPLVAGDFVWVRFASDRLVDLGTATIAPLDLPAGVSAFSHTNLPLGFTGHALVESLGLANVNGVRVLDPENGQWHTLAVGSGEIRGADFHIPTVAVVIVDLVNPISDWSP